MVIPTQTKSKVALLLKYALYFSGHYTLIDH